jgi:adenylate cyclase
VRIYRIPLAETARTKAPLPLPDKPSLAVLPFQNMTGDAEQDYFVDGIVEEITTAISRLPWLFVIARNSSFTYKGRAVDVKQVARELGVRYVLEGSARKAGNRVRITGQLIDTTSGAHIWADRFDGALDDIFELQDQVASSVVGAIEPKLRRSEIERVTQKPTESLDAYDLYLRALAEFNKLTEDGMLAAIALLERALAIDSTYVPAVALTGFCRVLQRTHGWIAPAGLEAAAGLRLARQAVEAGRDDSDVLWMASYTLAALAGENAAAMRGIDRALVLNPNSAHAWMAKGLVSCFSKRPDAAIEAFMRAMRLSPLDPLGYVFRFGLALANFIAGRYEEALEWAEQSAREQPRYVPPLRLKVVICALLDRLEDAQASLRQLLDLHPGLTMANFYANVPVMSPELRDAYADGFRKAGLPEE